MYDDKRKSNPTELRNQTKILRFERPKTKRNGRVRNKT